MKKHSLKLALLGTTLVAAAAIAGPAFAGPDCSGAVDTDNKCIAVLWSDRADTLIEITNAGVTREVYCHHNLKLNEPEEDGDPWTIDSDSESMLHSEAFAVCVGGAFHVGNDGDEALNLNPFDPNPNNPVLDPDNEEITAAELADKKKNPFGFGRPFVLVGAGSTAKTVYLESNGNRIECGDGNIAPLYDLDHQDLDSKEATVGTKSLLLGTMVNLIEENTPNNGKCIGVRTTFQFRVGTCKIWKVRKYFNTCKTAQTITQIKELEEVHEDMELAGASNGPGGAFTAVGQEDGEDHYVTLTTSNTQANPGNATTPFYQRSAAGSVADGDFGFNPEFCACRTLFDAMNPDSFTSAQVERDKKSWLEVFLSYFPGGVKLQPNGKSGSEKFITWFIDIE